MKTVTMNQAQEDFRGLVAGDKSEPVEIVEGTERIGVFIPDADAELIEDLLLAQKAAAAKAEGFIGADASKAFLDRLRNAQD